MGENAAGRVELYLMDDERAGAWSPFALSRPVGELRFGTLLLRERLERFAGRPARGSLTSRDWLRSYAEPGAPPVLGPGDLPRAAPRLLLLSRFVPAEEASFVLPDGPVTYRSGGRVVGWFLPPGAPAPDPAWLREPAPLPRGDDTPLDGRVLGDVWELVTGLPERLARDLEEDLRGAPSAESPGAWATADVPAPPSSRAGAAGFTVIRDPAALPEGVERIGEHPILLGRDVRVEPGVLFDTRHAPVRLDDGVEARAGARLEGPLHAGPHSRLLGGPVGCVAAGAYSYLRGEVEKSIVLGYTNKAHDGFLGHSVLGRWVNLGAMTTNSDLKNNYGPVRVGGPEGDRETGAMKVGVFLGDHVKTAIGTMLNSGTVVGTGSNVYEGTPPRWVPPFSWGTGADRTRYRKAAFLEVAARVMQRRDFPFTEATEAWLGDVWEAGRDAERGQP